MSKESAYKSWLQQGGAQTEAGRNTRAYAIRTIEPNLSALGLPYKDLDVASDGDRFVALRERLSGSGHGVGDGELDGGTADLIDHTHADVGHVRRSGDVGRQHIDNAGHWKARAKVDQG